MRAKYLLLVVFVVAVVGTGSLIGLSFPPGDWYAGLEKPGFNPPNWLFGPVWTALYVLIGIVGWRVWCRSEDAGLRMLWGLQMALNFAWSPVFFGAHRIGLALGILIALILVVLAFLWRARVADRVSALMFLPYLAWISFAGLLNAAILALN